MSYTAPLQDIAFAIEEIAGIGEIAGLAGYGEASPVTVSAAE
jgi:hypothetical protein